jgi:hypothetical protein
MFRNRKGCCAQDLFNPVNLPARPVKKYPHLFGRRGFGIKVISQLGNNVAEDLSRVMGFGNETSGHIEQKPLHNSGTHEKIVQNSVCVGQKTRLLVNEQTLQLYRALVEFDNRAPMAGDAR